MPMTRQGSIITRGCPDFGGSGEGGDVSMYAEVLLVVAVGAYRCWSMYSAGVRPVTFLKTRWK